MDANSSQFVTMNSSNLGKTVLNWYLSFSLQCNAEGQQKTWVLFKNRLRARFRPKDFEYNLRERLFCLKQTGAIHEYVSRFQDLMSQSELEISELEKGFYFQNGLRSETENKIKEKSPSLLKEAIEITTNFEFAHYVGKPPKSAPSQSAKSTKPATKTETKGSNSKSRRKIGRSPQFATSVE